MDHDVIVIGGGLHPFRLSTKRCGAAQANFGLEWSFEQGAGQRRDIHVR